MLSYNGDHAFKRKFIELLKWHQEQDHLQKGTYGTFCTEEGHKRHINSRFPVPVIYRTDHDELLERLSWKGCAIGCSWASYQQLTKGRANYGWMGDREGLALGLGVPTRLLQMEDAIFENLPDSLAQKWPVRFATALPVGADLEDVVAHFPHYPDYFTIKDWIAYANRLLLTLRAVRSTPERRTDAVL